MNVVREHTLQAPHRSGRVFAPLAATVNGFKTVAVLGGLGGLLVAVGSAFGRSGAFIGLVLGVLVAGGSYWFADKIALAAAGAVAASPAAHPQYHRIVRNLCREAGLPMPRLYVTPDLQPNAFSIPATAISSPSPPLPRGSRTGRYQVLRSGTSGAPSSASR